MPRVSAAHLDARREQILRAACICMARKGFDGATMRDICRQAGLSAGAVYSYFSSKEDIVRAMAGEALRNNAAAFAEVRERKGLRERFGELLRIFLANLATADLPIDMARLKVGLWAGAVRDPEVLSLFHESYRLVFEELAGWVREAQQDGEVRPDVQPEAAAQVMVSLLEGFTLQKAVDPESDAERYGETLVAILAGGFLARKEE